MSSLLQVEGWRGLYAGYGSFLLRDLPFDAIEFVAYEQLKALYKVPSQGPNVFEQVINCQEREARECCLDVTSQLSDQTCPSRLK